MEAPRKKAKMSFLERITGGRGLRSQAKAERSVTPENVQDDELGELDIPAFLRRNKR